jgi:hypothetical protein
MSLKQCVGHLITKTIIEMVKEHISLSHLGTMEIMVVTVDVQKMSPCSKMRSNDGPSIGDVVLSSRVVIFLDDDHHLDPVDMSTIAAKGGTRQTQVPLVEKGLKPAGTIYFYRRIRLSTDCVISSGGSLRKPPLEIVFLLAVP